GAAANLFAYDTKSKTVRQLSTEKLWDVRSFGAFDKTVVYETSTGLKELDLASGVAKPLSITLAAEIAQARPQWKDASKTITSARLSPTGKRLVVSARGDIFTVPVKDGSIRNLTQTSGIREKDGLWSADGRQIAYITESNMEHFLVVRDQAGLEAPKTYPLGKPG